MTPKSYFLRPETRHRPHQSSQYDAFPSQARDQCFTRLAKMRLNMVTYWITADFANRETCSFIRLKMIHSGKLCCRLLPLALISNVVVFYATERIMGSDMKRRRGGGGVGKDVKSIRNTWFFLVYCSLLELFCTETKDGQLLNKPQTRYPGCQRLF